MSEMIIRDRRVERRFFVDNDLLDQYGHILGAAGLAVYMVLCRHAHIDSQESFLKHQTIADKIGVSVSTVKRSLNQLRALMLIDWAPMYRQDGSQTCNEYVLLTVPETPVLRTDMLEAAGFEDVEPSQVSENHTPAQGELPPSSPVTQHDQSLHDQSSHDQSPLDLQAGPRFTRKGVQEIMEEIEMYPKPTTLAGLRVTIPPATQLSRVVELELEEGDDKWLHCPICNHVQPWPHIERERSLPRTLRCEPGSTANSGCGAYFVVRAPRSYGEREMHTYRHPQIPEQKWEVEVPDFTGFGKREMLKEHVAELIYWWLNRPGVATRAIDWMLRKEGVRRLNYIQWGARLLKAMETIYQGDAAETVGTEMSVTIGREEDRQELTRLLAQEIDFENL